MVSRKKATRAVNWKDPKRCGFEMPDVKLAKIADPPLKLDLGCGQRPAPGFKGVDLYAPNADYKVDLFSFPWPFADESVDELYCSHFFEHVPAKLRFLFMDECWRILKLGSKFNIICPDGSSDRAVQDPTHEWPPIVPTSFLYFDQSWRIANGLDHYQVQCNFMSSVNQLLEPEYQLRNRDFLAHAQRAWRNVNYDVYAVLTKIQKIPRSK